MANSFRTLEAIGWQHAEPVLRSLTYAILDRLAPSLGIEGLWGERQNLDGQFAQTKRINALCQYDF